MAAFADALRGLRHAAGHPSARAFYKGAGGPRFFNCTYKAYLNIEAGRSLPHPRLAMRIAVGLGVVGDRPKSKEFVSAYVRTMAGGGPFADFLARSLASRKAEQPKGSLFHRAVQRVMAESTVPLSREHCRVQLASGEHYWAFTVLQDDQGSWSPAELAGLLGLPERGLRNALSDLEDARLVARDKDGRWRCPFAGRIFTYPRDEFYVSGYLPAMRGRWEEMAAKRGRSLLHRHLFTRASENALRDYFPYLAQSVYGAHIYSTKAKSADTAFFALSAQVRKVLEF